MLNTYQNLQNIYYNINHKLKKNQTLLNKHNIILEQLNLLYKKKLDSINKHFTHVNKIQNKTQHKVLLQSYINIIVNLDKKIQQYKDKIDEKIKQLYQENELFHSLIKLCENKLYKPKIILLQNTIRKNSVYIHSIITIINDINIELKTLKNNDNISNNDDISIKIQLLEQLLIKLHEIKKICHKIIKNSYIKLDNLSTKIF